MPRLIGYRAKASATGTALRVATQLSDPLNAMMAAAAPGIELLPMDGLDWRAAPSGATVLIPNPIGGSQRLLPRPDHWPHDLQWVHLISAGIDIYPPWLFDVPIVTRSVGLTGPALAEFCMAAILSQAKALDDLWVRTAEHWTPRTTALVAGSNLGIVGFGAIGKPLAQLARAFGMQVKVLRKSSAPLPDGVGRARDLEELFRHSDHVVLAVPADYSTERMVDAAVLRHAKPGLHLVNVARGKLIDHDALLTALDDGPLGFATLDVTDPEPPPVGSRLYQHPRIRLSPHSAGIPPDIGQRLADLFAANVLRFRARQPMLHQISPPFHIPEQTT